MAREVIRVASWAAALDLFPAWRVGAPVRDVIPDTFACKSGLSCNNRADLRAHDTMAGSRECPGPSISNVSLLRI